MPQRRPPTHTPAKTNTPARQRAPRVPEAAARDNWQPGQAGRAATPKHLLTLQRLFGNRAVQGLVQPKLEVGPAADAHERQAEAVADRVAATVPPPNNGLVRASTSATRSATRTAARMVQRRSALVSAKTTTRKFTGSRSANLDEDVAAVETSPKGQSYGRLEVVELYDAKQSHISDKAGAIAWFRIQSGKGSGEFIKGSKVIGGL